MRIGMEKRIWINNARLDTIIQRHSDDIIDKNWTLSVNEDSDKAYSFEVPKAANVTLQINEAFPVIIVSNIFKIYKSNESIEFYLDDTYSIAGYCCIDKYIDIEIMHDDAQPDEYCISVKINDVPYKTLSENLIYKLGLINYPLVWTIRSGGFESAQHMIIQLSADKPPKAIVAHDVSTTYYKNIAELHAMHMTRFEQSVYGIIKNAIVLARLDMMNESSLFDGKYSDAKLYIITEMSDGCPFKDATITLRPIEVSSPITITFKEFIYAYRGVLPPNSAIVMDSKVYICTNGIAICRKATSELESLISDCIAPPKLTNEKLEQMDKYICDNYVHSNMVDKIIIVDKNYGIITHNVMLQNDKPIGKECVLTIEEDF